MITQRQLEILLEFCENSDTYITASYFADRHQVSLRTIQNDIKAIKDEVESYPCITFQSSAPKGSRIAVKDAKEFSALKENLYIQYGNLTIGYQNERIHELLQLLLRQHRSISYYDVESTMFVSRSTLQNDLKQVDSVLQKYKLELLRGSNRIVIEGDEINKRQCILEENLLLPNTTTAQAEEENYELMQKIKTILVETFISFEHIISEVELNNMIVLLVVAIQRMQNYFFIEPSEQELCDEGEVEHKIAQEIMDRLKAAFSIRIPKPEIEFLAVYLKGRSSVISQEVITPEIDNLVLDGLREIRSVFNIDLTNDIDLRIALSMHCTQLVLRLQYDMQMKTHIADYIRQSYPQGFEMAIYFASFLQKRYGVKVVDSEIALLAIHLYKGLCDLQNSHGTKHVLLISTLRRSENILLRETLYNWFGSEMAELSVITPADMNESYLDRYDTFLTTEKGKYYDIGLAFYINPFPTQQDCINLKLAMDGFESIDDIFQIFRRDHFDVFRDGCSRDDVLSAMCRKASSLHNIEGLQHAVMERESLGSTYFGNGIAAPHPIFSVSSDTFISVGILPKKINWDDEGNQVNLVLLVCIGKNNSKAFQLWNYMSKIFADPTFVPHLLENNSYENFLKQLRNLIAGDFNH